MKIHGVQNGQWAGLLWKKQELVDADVEVRDGCRRERVVEVERGKLPRVSAGRRESEKGSGADRHVRIGTR